MIRTANEQDSEALLQGILQTYRDMESPLIQEIPLEKLEEWINICMDKEDYRYRYENAQVAIRDGKVAGMVFGYKGELEKEQDQSFKALMEENGYGFLIADAFDLETHAGEWYLDLLLTDLAFRRQGVASELLESLPERALAAGETVIGLNCDQNNERAKRLYEKQGFKKVGEVLLGTHLYDHMEKSAMQ